jgi:AhpD family alkylhydroperoxidase
MPDGDGRDSWGGLELSVRTRSGRTHPRLVACGGSFRERQHWFLRAFFHLWDGLRQTVIVHREKTKPVREREIGKMRSMIAHHSTTNVHQEVIMYDTKNLSKMKTLADLAPEAMKAFVAFDKAAVAEGAIPVKYKELIALGVAFTTQCPYCIEIHSNNARKAGTSDQEIAEAVLVAAALRAGGAITHGTHALK